MFSEDLPSAKAWHIFNKFSSKIRAIFQNNGYSESFVLKQLNIFLITYRKWVNTMTAYLKRRAFFSIRVFFHGHWQLTGEQGKRGDHLLFHSTTSTRSRTFRHLFATLHVRWLSHIFNRNACIYQAATRWHLPAYRITIRLIDDVILIFLCLHVELILGFVTTI